MRRKSGGRADMDRGEGRRSTPQSDVIMEGGGGTVTGTMDR